MTKRDMNKIQ